MNIPFRRSLLVALLGSSIAAAQAGGSVEASARALEHSMQALGYTIEAGLKLAFGAAAVPLTVAGGVGEASRQAGNEFMEFANAPPSGPLPVSDELVTAGPTGDAQHAAQEKSGEPKPGGQLKIEKRSHDPSPDQELNAPDKAQ